MCHGHVYHGGHGGVCILWHVTDTVFHWYVVVHALPPTSA